MDRQYTDWGYIDWLSSETDRQKSAMNIGLVSIDPHTHMSAHIHFTEQVILTLGGNGYSLINGQKIDMSQKDKFFHWPPGVTHEMFNTGNVKFKHLMVSCPDNVGLDGLSKLSGQNKKLNINEISEYLSAAIAGTRLDSLGYSYVIFDSIGNFVTRTKVFPAYCLAHCEQELITNSAPCMGKNVNLPIHEEDSFLCPFELSVMYVPIIFQGCFLGYIQGGFIHTKPTGKTRAGVYVTPRSSILGAQALLKRIARAMENFCELHKLKTELFERDLEIADKLEYQELLATNLKEVENTVTDLKINNHFLFNTLNQMASMALEGGVVALYHSIVDLAKLFHYTLRNNNNVVVLDKEFEYLQAYLKLQKLRYEENLMIEYDVNIDLEVWEVPFNFLMPIAENAFKHGFVDETLKWMRVYIDKDDARLRFAIENNGVTLNKAECQKVLTGMKSDSAHGLSMIYRKLQAFYGDKFQVDITSNNGLTVHLTLPAKQISTIPTVNYQIPQNR